MSDRELERLADKIEENTRLNSELYEPLPPYFGKEPIMRGLTLRQCPPKGGVYGLFDPKTDQMMRSGRTGDLASRQGQHGRDALLKGFEFRPLFRTDDYAEQRGLEQIVHWRFRPPFNYINPISSLNENRMTYINSASLYLMR